MNLIHFKQIALSCLLSLFVVVASAQNQTITLDLKNAPLSTILGSVEKQIGKSFFYEDNLINLQENQSISVSNADLKTVIDKLFNKKITYSQTDQHIVLQKVKTADTVVPTAAGPSTAQPAQGTAPADKSQTTAAGNQNLPAVKGVITDAEGEPLTGAVIKVKGNDKKMVTADLDGNFTMTDVPVNATLVVSFLGYDNTEYVLNGRADIAVIMKGNAVQLDEVVVTGYGSFKKSAYAGSAAVIKTEKLEDIPVLSVNDLLLGNASGVTLSSGSSQPGSPSEIRIRGIGSFNASKSPLYVIDGVPVISGDVSSVSGSSTTGLDVMSSLNTSDIENIAVIKDAAAASLYGSRAANGVIIITTKSGKKGKAQFNVRADMGFSNFAMPYRTVMNGQDRRDLIMEGLYNEYILKGKTEEESQAYAAANIDKYAPVPWCGFVDWDDVLFRTGFYQNYEASVAGGNDNMRYFSSLNYTDQNGTTMNSGLKRITGRVNVDWDVNKKFSIGVKALFSKINQDVFSEGTGYTSPFYSSRNAVVPSDPVYLEDGTYNRSFIRNGKRNPKLSMDYDYKTEALTRAFNTAYAQYEFIDNLKLRTSFSYDYNLSNGDTYSDPRTSDGESSNGSRTKRMSEYQKWVWSTSLGYNFNFLENHHFDALVAYDMEDFMNDYLSGNTKNFAIPDLDAIANGAEPTSVSGSPSEWRMVSFISRANYNYASKYYLGASLRYDGSSRFSREDNARWGTFWSVSGAWRILEEAFMQDSKNVLSELRLRASYGTNGNLPGDYYGYYGLSSLSSAYAYQSGPGMAVDQIPNAALSWENNYNLNVGVDVGLFNRLNFTVEFYNRKTTALLMPFPISATTGSTSYDRNVGEMRNRGIEFEVSSLNFDTKDFRWTTSFNIGHNKNEILQWDGNVTESASGNLIRRVGLPYNTFYLYEFAGIDPADGTPQFYLNTENADGTLNHDITKDYTKAKRIAYKSPEPTVAGGLTNTLAYKWFDLSFLVSYQFGGYTYDNGAQKTEHGGSDIQANMPAYYSERWQKPGDVTEIEQFVANRAVAMSSIASTRRVHSSDFIRLKNLTFGVKLPKEWITPIGLQQVRFYCSGNNLLTWAKWSEYDPESADKDGYVQWTQPPLKTWTFGVDIKF